MKSVDPRIPGGGGHVPSGPGHLPGHLQGGHIPLTSEWFETQKKMLKQAGIDKQSAAEKADDVYTPSMAAQQLPSSKQDKFLDNVKPQILALAGEISPESEEFVQESTRKLVGGVLQQEYGENMTRNPAYPQMEEKIARTILNDGHHRDTVVDFLDALLMSQHPAAPAAEEG